MTVTQTAFAVLLGFALHAQTSQPNQITDDRAFAHFFLTCSGAPKEQPAALERRQIAFANHVGLPEIDIRAMIDRCNIFRAENQTYQTAVASLRGSGQVLGSDAKERLASLNRARAERILSLARQLFAELTPLGVERLRAYIDNVMKPNIRIGNTTSR